MPVLTIHDVGQGVTVQDLGRPGWTARGLSQGGAADRHALLEAAAILQTSKDAAVLEMTGLGGTFSVSTDMRIALTGAQMQATVEGETVAPNTSYLLQAGQRLTVRGAQRGVYGYLAFAGGIKTKPILGSRATHLTAGIGGRLAAGDTLSLGADPNPFAGPTTLSVEDRLGGGIVRVMPGPQTDHFNDEVLQAFANTAFRRNPRGNRQGVRLDYDGSRFAATDQLNILSDLIVQGDIQMTGDGVPYVLLAECQTIGGYPRIGTVIPADLPKVAQVMPGATLRFQFLSVDEADATTQSDETLLKALSTTCRPLIRDPHDIADLLGYQLISGVTPGDDLERP